MLTVKHIENSGVEAVFEVSEIRRMENGHLVFGQEKIVSTGRIYVMNETGKTVAVYHLDKQEQTNGK